MTDIPNIQDVMRTCKNCFHSEYGSRGGLVCTRLKKIEYDKIDGHAIIMGIASCDEQRCIFPERVPGAAIRPIWTSVLHSLCLWFGLFIICVCSPLVFIFNIFMLCSSIVSVFFGLYMIRYNKKIYESFCGTNARFWLPKN